MGSIAAWILIAVVYGLMCGGVYTWTSSRREGSMKLFVRSSAAFALLGVVMVILIFKILDT